jgi:hypothetical protein
MTRGPWLEPSLLPLGLLVKLPLSKVDFQNIDPNALGEVDDMSTGLHLDDGGPTVALGTGRDYSRGYRRRLRTAHPDCGCDLVALAQMTRCVSAH